MNKPTEKQKCIAEQSVYVDLVMGKKGQLTEMERRLAVTLSLLPILRRMSDLTEEITHRGYNNNQPFIPLVELAKISYGYSHNDLNSTGVVLCGSKPYAIQSHFAEDDISGMKHFDLLHLWHFDTRNLIGKGEAIDVNLLAKNPYEV